MSLTTSKVNQAVDKAFEAAGDAIVTFKIVDKSREFDPSTNEMTGININREILGFFGDSEVEYENESSVTSYGEELFLFRDDVDGNPFKPNPGDVLKLVDEEFTVRVSAPVRFGSSIALNKVICD